MVKVPKRANKVRSTAKKSTKKKAAKTTAATEKKGFWRSIFS